MTSEKRSTGSLGGVGGSFDSAWPQIGAAQSIVENFKNAQRQIYEDNLNILAGFALNHVDYFKKLSQCKEPSEIYACNGEFARANSVRLFEAARHAFNASTTRLNVLEKE